MNNDWPCASGWGLSVLIRSMHYRGRWSVKQWALSFRRLPPPQLQAMEGREATGYTSDAKGSGDIQHADEINGDQNSHDESICTFDVITLRSRQECRSATALQASLQIQGSKQGGPTWWWKRRPHPHCLQVSESLLHQFHISVPVLKKKNTLFFFSDWQLQHSVLFDQLIKGTLQTSGLLLKQQLGRGVWCLPPVNIIHDTRSH